MTKIVEEIGSTDFWIVDRTNEKILVKAGNKDVKIILNNTTSNHFVNEIYNNDFSYNEQQLLTDCNYNDKNEFKFCRQEYKIKEKIIEEGCNISIIGEVTKLNNNELILEQPKIRYTANFILNFLIYIQFIFHWLFYDNGIYIEKNSSLPSIRTQAYYNSTDNSNIIKRNYSIKILIKLFIKWLLYLVGSPLILYYGYYWPWVTFVFVIICILVFLLYHVTKILYTYFKRRIKVSYISQIKEGTIVKIQGTVFKNQTLLYSKIKSTPCVIYNSIFEKL